MWFEILPSFTIVVGALAIPHFACMALHQLVLGNMFKRSLMSQDLRLQYLRDIRLTGDAYVTNGLESIPDE